MFPFRDEEAIVYSRTGFPYLWFYFSIEFLICAVFSSFLSILGFIKTLLPEPPRSLTSDVVLIAGAASSTLGVLLTEEFAKTGCSVICIDNDLRFVEKIIKRLKSQYNKIEKIGPDYRKYWSRNVKPTIISYKCDLLDRDAICEVAKKIEDEIGDIDVLVTCAGQSNQDIFDVASTTLMSHYWTMLTFLPSLLQSYSYRPYIIGITPIASSQDAYSSSRMMIAGLMESLGQELSNQNNNLTFLGISPIVEHSNLRRQKEQQLAKDVIQAISRDQCSINNSWFSIILYRISCAIYSAITTITE